MIRRFLIFGILFSLLIIPNLSLAATTISSELLNGSTANASLNLNDSSAKVDVTLTASEPVKWSTIAICNINDDACSRTTAVKYFTSTSDYSATVVKTWDGKTSAGSNVAVGDYKIKVTIKNAASEESVVTLNNYLIKVVSGDVVTSTSVANTNDSQAISDSSDDNGTSAHLSSTPLSSTKETVWQLDLGRERQVLVDQVVPFVAKDVSGAPTDSNIVWSFGDGWSGAGREVFHRYSRPGTYEVVANGHSNKSESVARTRITVLAAEFTASWEGLDEEGALILTNNQNSEVNLGGLVLLASGTPKFTLPLDTLLPAGQKIVLESSLTHLNGEEETTLITPAGRVLVNLKPEPKRVELLAAVGELQQKLITVKNKLNSRSVAKTNIETNLGLTASPTKADSQANKATTTTIKLMAQSADSWWQRWLKFIRVP